MLSSLTFMVGSINLIGGYHYGCEKNEHYITMLWEYNNYFPRMGEIWKKKKKRTKFKCDQFVILKFVKTQLHNRMGDEFIADNLVASLIKKKLLRSLPLF